MLLITIVAAILAVPIAYTFSKFLSAEQSKLIEPRVELLSIGVQIICGDCCGDAQIPIKTYVDRCGNCAQCGGRSYVLASSRVVNAQQLMVASLSEYNSDTRFEPSEGRTRLYAVRAHRLTA